MKKTFYLSYALLCYAVFFATFLYLIGFVGNWEVPKSIDRFPDGGTTGSSFSVLINLGLITLFGLQHSIMARKGFKQWLKQFIPEVLERSTYVLVASSVLLFLFLYWQPMPALVWNAGSGTGAYILLALSLTGWGIVLLSTFLINHFHLFGLQQAYDYAQNKQAGEPHFRVPFLYRLVRHPLYLGFLMAFWFTPQMTTGHLLFASAITVYILIGIYHEEKDLVRQFGYRYKEYREGTSKIIPLPRRRNK